MAKARNLKSKILFSKININYRVQINEKLFVLLSSKYLTNKKKHLRIFWLRYFFLFINNYEVFYLNNTLNKKVFQIFLKKGLKHSAIQNFSKGLGGVKYFLNIEIYLFKFFFFNIFKLPLAIKKRQKGRKTIIIPEIFHPDKLLNVTIHSFYYSILKKKKKIFQIN